MEKKRFYYNLFYPSILVFLMAFIKWLEYTFEFRLSFLGIIPLKIEGLGGILFSPLLHGDYDHLFSNLVPCWLLTFGLFYYYRDTAIKIFPIAWILPGILTWLLARGPYPHIGASGLVYTLAAFHIASGFIHREKGLMAFAMLVVFLYGSIIWGIFPEFFPEKNISWEGHLSGLITGIVLAIYFRKSGPQRKVWEWPEENTPEDDDENEYWNTHTSAGNKKDIHYSIKKD
ncbi:MAG: rhomboid family intramembrane serine protease [Bacteroidales bacterium]|nr:rhomboid family intramembrane serine protease [Bacteroidales bacterium]